MKVPINPVSDKEIIDTELQLKDLESVEKKISTNRKTDKNRTKVKAELEVLIRCKEHWRKAKISANWI